MDKRLAYKLRHKKLGLCTDCSRPAKPGGSQCKMHTAKYTIRTIKCIKRRLDNGLCRYCGRPLTSEDSGFKTHNRQACSPYRKWT